MGLGDTLGALPPECGGTGTTDVSALIKDAQLNAVYLSAKNWAKAEQTVYTAKEHGLYLVGTLRASMFSGDCALYQKDGSAITQCAVASATVSPTSMLYAFELDAGSVVVAGNRATNTLPSKKDKSVYFQCELSQAPLFVIPLYRL